MIIVETKDGKTFVNENAIKALMRKKNSAEVYIYDDGPNIISDVESVRYIANKQDVDIKDEGNELAELRKLFRRHTEWADHLRTELLDKENRIEELEAQIRAQQTIYMVVADCDNDETRNVACFSTRAKAETYCNDHNKGMLRERFTIEEWQTDKNK